jgi:acetolactate synthase-1/2/3 large subunit
MLNAQRGLLRPEVSSWLPELRERDREREDAIARVADQATEYVNPVAFFGYLENFLEDQSILVADGGDFVATAAYTLSPRKPLSWLDPGVFGTLGVGGGFALGAKLARPDAEVWIVYGDGSAAYSLAEFDTFVRHRIPLIAIVGNDASWAQIAREQIALLKDEVGTVLRRTNYHVVAEGYGGRGILVDRVEEIEPALREARRLAAEGFPVLINLLIGKTDFRKGSISM